MATDAAIYSLVGQNPVQPVTPLTLTGQTAQTAASLQALQQQNALFRAQAAVGQAVQAATDPITGTVNQGKARALIAANSGAALDAQAGVGTSIDQQASQQTRSAAAQANVNRTILALSDLPDSDMTGDTFKSHIGALVQSGDISDIDAKAAESDLPPDGSSPALYRRYVLAHAIQNLNTPDAMGTVYGQNAQVNTGARQIQGVLASPAMGGGFQGATAETNQLGPQFVDNGRNLTPTNAGVPTGAPFQKYVDPNFLAGRTVVTDSHGNKIYLLNANITPSNLSGDNTLGDGRYPSSPSLRNPAVSGDAPPGAPLRAGISPSQEAALTETGNESAKQFQSIADQGVQAKSQVAMLQNMLGDSQNFASGQTNLNAYKATLTKYLPAMAASLGVDPKSVAANESFDKLANQIASTQGAGSDARLAVAQHANPNSSLSPAGVNLVIRQLTGNADYLQARSQLAAAYPDKTDRAGFEAQIGQQLDPRVFQYNRLDPQQKATYYKSLADKNAFKSAYSFAQQNGLIGAQNANQ